MNVGERIAQARRAVRWTQADLAAACGVSRRTLIRWEMSPTGPARINDLHRLAAVLGLPLRHFTEHT